MTDNVTNFLASGIEIKGTIRFQNDMHIDGNAVWSLPLWGRGGVTYPCRNLCFW